jgi:hypothetical protein
MVRMVSFGIQGWKDSGFCWGAFGFRGRESGELFRLLLVVGGDVSAVPCETFEDRLEDRAAKNDYVLIIGNIGEI